MLWLWGHSRGMARREMGYRPHRMDEVPPFRLELKVIGFGGMTEMPAS
jgi:hypothetical protein